MTSKMIAPMRKAVISSVPAQRKYLAVPTSPAARPPNACDSAVRCGTAVSATRDSGTPAIVPRTMATRIHS